MLEFEQSETVQQRSRSRRKTRKSLGVMTIVVLALVSILLGSVSAQTNTEIEKQDLINENEKIKEKDDAAAAKEAKKAADVVEEDAEEYAEIKTNLKRIEFPSIAKKEKHEGLLLESPPTYINFTGQDGLELEISMPTSGQFDYTLMFWFRSVKSYKELSEDDSIKDGQYQYLFEIPNDDEHADKDFGVACYITDRGSGPILSCGAPKTDKVLDINLINLPDIQQWMHLTFSTNNNAVSDASKENSGYSYVRIDTSNHPEIADIDRHFAMKIPKSKAKGSVYYGSNSKKVNGFPGHYRQFWITLGYLEPQNIKFLMHQQKVLDYSTMGYYKFEQTILYDKFADAFRQQVAKPVNIQPSFEIENIAAPFCNSIPQKFEQVPQFYKSAGNKFKGLDIPRFNYKGREIGYTASFWLKNFGQHSFSTKPHEGRESHHMFKLDECFAIWYDSPTSFRVYVYAKNNYEEVYSKRIFLPLYEWVNIQINFDQQRGIIVMTFNQNGERQQNVESKIYLADQYPRGQLHLFQSFVGLPYQLHIWERSIKLPINFDDDDLEEEKIVSFDFTKNNYEKIESGPQKFEGWISKILKNGQPIAAKEGEGFDFIYANVPLNYQSDQSSAKKVIGTLQAESTQWNNVTCPSPDNSQMFLGSVLEKGELKQTAKSMESAVFTTAILVDKTQEYTVEFWFKAVTGKADEIIKANKDGTSVTYLYNMEDQEQNHAMAIYVEDGVLKCGPYGKNDTKLVLEYKGIDPLNTNEWQHISCIYKNNMYVKGQYLKVDMDPNAADKDFTAQILRPTTFAKVITNSGQKNLNEEKQRRWTIALGQMNKGGKKHFAGSFRDVRLWKSARTDAELYSKRFNQINRDADLAGNLKFMDGNPYIFNSADTSNAGGIEFANIEPNMLLSKSDKKNLICASDTYFDPIAQSCTRYPYTKPVSIVYMVTNNVQHGHQMVMQNIVKSPMFLPGKYQPETRSQWSMISSIKDIDEGATDQEKEVFEAAKELASAVQKKYFQQNERTFYNFDPIFMGDFKDYKLKVKMNDEAEHNFFVTIEQELIPRKCIQVVDQNNSDFDQNSKEQLITENGDETLTIDFYVKRIEGCVDEKPDNKLMPYMHIESQPPMPEGVVEQLNKNVKQGDQPGKQTLTITKDIISQMTKNIPIDLIFYLFWKVNDGSDRTSYMNILYRVTLVEKIDVQWSRMDLKEIKPDSSSNVVDTTEGNPDLILSALDSKFEGKSPIDGLSFKWECNADQGENLIQLQSECEKWNGSPVLQISHDLIKNNSWIDKEIRITLTASSIETSEMEEPIPQNQTAIFIWVSSVTANFDIVFDNVCKPATDETCPFFKDQTPRVLVSVDQTIRVEPIGWKAFDGYKFDYEIVTVDGSEVSILDPKQTGTTFLIKGDTLKKSTNYKIIVTVTNEKLDYVKSMTKEATFFTGITPSIQELLIDPIEGEMFSTDFTITLNNIKGVDPEYLLYGIVTNGDDPLKLMTKREDYNSTAPPISRQLPELTSIRVYVYDKFGEKAYAETAVTVTKDPNDNWVTIANEQKTNKKSDSGLWQNFLQIGTQANNAAQKSGSEKDKADAEAVNKLIADDAFNHISKIPRNWQKGENSSDEEYDTVVESVIQTIGQVSTFSEFMEVDVLQKFSETVEYILRIDSIIEEITKDKTLRTNFANAIGNLMEQISKQAYVKDQLSKYRVQKKDLPDITWSRRMLKDSFRSLQGEEEAPAGEVDGDEVTAPVTPVVPAESDEPAEPETQEKECEGKEKDCKTNQYGQNDEDLDKLRKLMKKLIVVKNSYLDYICKSNILDSVESIKIQGDMIQFQLMKHYLTSIKPEFMFSDADNTVELTLPTGKISKKSENFAAAKWVCYQATFSIANPVAGYTMDAQFYHRNTKFIQVGSVDNLGNRWLDKDDEGNYGLVGQESNPMKIEFFQDLTKENQFYDGQTICEHFNGNNEDFKGQPWSDQKINAEEIEDDPLKTITKDCTAIYKYEDPQSILCTCSEIHNFYYTVITDKAQTLIVPTLYQDETHTVLYAILIPLIFVGLVFPIILIYLDSEDYQKVEDNFYPVDDLMIAKLQYSRHHLCKQMVYYKEKEIAEYRKLREFRSGSVAAFMTFHRTLHPYFSLFSRFDYQYKRLTRFSFILGQWCLITLLLWICYSKLFFDWGVTDFMGDHRPFYVSLGLSIFTLPMPRRCCCFFRTQMYLLQIEEDVDSDDDEEKQSMKQAQETAVDGDEDTPAPVKVKEDDGVRAVLFDNWLQLKCVCILFIFIFWAITICIFYLFADYSGGNEDKRALQSFVELTIPQAEEFVMCWYLAIFVWGVIINELRIVIISLMAPIRAQTLYERQMAIMKLAPVDDEAKKDETQEEIDRRISKMKTFKEKLKNFHASWWQKASFATCCLIPPESVEIALDALFTIEIEKEKGKLFPDVIEDEKRDFAFNVKKNDREKMREAIKNGTVWIPSILPRVGIQAPLDETTIGDMPTKATKTGGLSKRSTPGSARTLVADTTTGTGDKPKETKKKDKKKGKNKGGKKGNKKKKDKKKADDK